MKRAPKIVPTSIAEVFGILKTGRPPLSLADMDAAVADEARRQAEALRARNP